MDLLMRSRAALGEAPIWDGEARRLLWVDILKGEVHQLDLAAGENRSVSCGQHVGAVAPAARGRWAVAVRDGFGMLDPERGELELAAPVLAGDARVRMNDGKCDGAGRFWAGSQAYDLTPNAGALFRWDPDGEAIRALEDVTISNGIDWSADHRTMFYADSASDGIDAFDFDLETGTLGRRRRLADIAAAEGVADGLTVDAEDCLWVALWGGSAVLRFDARGRRIDRVDLPVTQVTSCTFAGPELDALVVTSARVDEHGPLNEAALRDQPLAGSIFVHDPGVTGKPANRFGG